MIKTLLCVIGGILLLMILGGLVILITDLRYYRNIDQEEARMKRANKLANSQKETSSEGESKE